MRLLQRSNADELSFTKDLSDHELQSYPYAILSHTWGDDDEEIKYGDIVAGIATTLAGAGSAKLRFCINQTKKDRLEYFWLDTCCIDKNNFVELDRSLRSMFRWYANARKCYVYLADLSKEKEHEISIETQFETHRWFRRGWTLQELLAPVNVEFFDKHGHHLGSKKSLEKQINEITRIPIPALRGQSLATFSITERKQWQADRETREPEDIVYSLLGIFDLSMPVLYGEGAEKAWQRLENAIVIAGKGPKHDEFELVFSLADAAVETEHFVAREAELQEIHKHLSSDGSRRIVVLRGLGGIGKTQLAISYAKRHQHDYSAVLWLNAKDETSTRLCFVKMAKQIIRQHPTAFQSPAAASGADLEATIDAVKTWLSMPLNTRWLLICDNYDNPRTSVNDDPTALELRNYIPEGYQGSIVVTTRSAEVALGHRIHIKKFEELQDSLRILEQMSGRSYLNHDDGAVRLAKKLDGLPLALATAGAYLSQSTITFDEYLGFFERSWTELHEHQAALMTYEDRTMYSTWRVSYDQIHHRNSLSAHLLHLWAYFDHQDLWFELLRHLANQDQEWAQQLVKNQISFYESMRVLCDHGLVEQNAGNAYMVESRGYSIHACVHAWMMAVLNSQYNESLARMALECVASRVPRRDEQDWSLLQRRLLDHANKCSKDSFELTSGDHDLAWAFYNIASLYADQGKLDKAETMYLRALSTCSFENEHGADHLFTLDTVNDLATLYRAQGKLEKAEQSYTKALTGREYALGADHPLTLETVNNLGLIHADQGKLNSAEKMYRRALEGKEKALGANDPSTLDTVDNLAQLYDTLGRKEKAEQMFMRALEGKEKVLGADHSSTLDTVHNFAVLYETQGKEERAEQMYVRALEGKEKALGADHPSTLRTVANLALLYNRQGKTEAEQMYMRALEGFEKAFGPDHDLTIRTVVHVGMLRCKQHRIDEAEGYCHRAKAVYSTLPPPSQSHVDDLANMISERLGMVRGSAADVIHA